MSRLLSLLVVVLPLLLTVGCPADDDDDTTGDDDVAPDPSWPEWAWHHWVWEDESTQDSALEVVHGYLDRDIPVGAVIIDSPWETAYNDFVWDTARFPDPQAMIDEFHDHDVRFLVWITPAINLDVEPLYSEFADAGWFMQYNADSGPAVIDWWKGEGSIIDYWNPDAVARWHEMMDPVLDMGIDGWKTDGLDFGAVVGSYSPALGRDVTRNEYSDRYYRDFYDYTRERNGDDCLIMARPVDNYGADIGGDGVAFAPIDINWAAWVGDQDASFVGLQAALRNMYWSSDYGYLLACSDIGGYRDDDSELGRDKEVMIRWAQQGALCPLMENGGGGEHRPWLFDAETEAIYRDFVELHYALLPYLNEEGARAFERGESLMPFVDHDTYTYLLGPDIFVAPIIEEGDQITVEFPDEGSWVWLFGDHQTFAAGAEETLTVPLDEYPVFLREGSDIAATLLP